MIFFWILLKYLKKDMTSYKLVFKITKNGRSPPNANCLIWTILNWLQTKMWYFLAITWAVALGKLNFGYTFLFCCFPETLVIACDFHHILMIKFDLYFQSAMNKMFSKVRFNRIFMVLVVTINSSWFRKFNSRTILNVLARHGLSERKIAHRITNFLRTRAVHDDALYFTNVS